MEDFEIYLFSSVIVTLAVYLLACLLHCFEKSSLLEKLRLLKRNLTTISLTSLSLGVMTCLMPLIATTYEDMPSVALLWKLIALFAIGTLFIAFCLYLEMKQTDSRGAAAIVLLMIVFSSNIIARQWIDGRDIKLTSISRALNKAAPMHPDHAE